MLRVHVAAVGARIGALGAPVLMALLAVADLLAVVAAPLQLHLLLLVPLLQLEFPLLVESVELPVPLAEETHTKDKGIGQTDHIAAAFEPSMTNTLKRTVHHCRA